MEIKTKFNIGDKIYYIDKMRNSGVIIDKYIIDDLKIYEGLNDEIKIAYNIRNPKISHDRHTVCDNELYSPTEINKILQDVKDILEKE